MNPPRYEDWIMQGDDEEICLNRPPWLSLLVIAIIIGIVLCLTSKSKASEPLFKPTGIYAIVESNPESVSELPAASTAAPIPAPQTAKELDAEIAKLIKQRDALRSAEKPKAIAGQKPVVFSNHRWVEQGTGRTSDAHLMNVHGFTADQIRGLTQDQKDRLHGADHEGLTRKVAKQPPGLPIIAKTYARSSNCPNGNCPLQRGR